LLKKLLIKKLSHLYFLSSYLNNFAFQFLFTFHSPIHTKHKYNVYIFHLLFTDNISIYLCYNIVYNILDEEFIISV